MVLEKACARCFPVKKTIGKHPYFCYKHQFIIIRLFLTAILHFDVTRVLTFYTLIFMCRNNESIDTSIVRNYQFNFVWKYTKLIGFSFLKRKTFCKKNIITYFVLDKWEFVLRMFVVLRPRIIHWKSAAFSLFSSLLFKDCRLKVRISPFYNLTWT